MKNHFEFLLPRAGKSSIIQFSSAIGLGILLNRLQQQSFNDVIGQEGYFLCARALHVLERTVYDTELCNRLDCFINIIY